MRHKWIAAFLSLIILAAPSIVAGQSLGVGLSPATPAPNPNPLFPERLGIPWFGVPQLGPYPQPSGMSSASSRPSLPPLNQIPPITDIAGQQFPSPISLLPTLHPEILYVGTVPILIFPLPLPPNPIVARLHSFGFLLQVPMINSPVENPGNR
jgi:hypothetical protein